MFGTKHTLSYRNIGKSGKEITHSGHVIACPKYEGRERE
jgi:hypothetical protein